MKNALTFLLTLIGLAYGSLSLSAQDYPFWLTDGSFKADEHPTSIASAGDFVATAGIYENDYTVFDKNYMGYYGVPCFTCLPYLSAFATLRDENSGSAWTATIFIDNPSSEINKRVDLQSVPQVDVTRNGEVYVSFTYIGVINVMDGNGQVVTIGPSGTGSDWDMAIFKFDQFGNYVWHVIEGSSSNDFITDIDYNEDNGLLGVAGYVEGNGPSLILNQGGLPSYPVQAASAPGTLGPNFGHAFAALYKDYGGGAQAIWARETRVYSYSNDIAVADNGQVYLSGIVRSAQTQIAGAPISSNYNCNSYDLQYFIVSFGSSASTIWAELYGSPNDKMKIARLLRNSSLAIHPAHNQVYHAVVSGGGNCNYFSEFGTYVSQIDAGSGAIMRSTPVGTTFGAYAAKPSYVPKGSPLYNPNIDVVRSSSSSLQAVEITGNFLLGDGSVSPGIQVGFEELEIGGSYLDIYSTQGYASAGYPEATGFYAALVDFSGGTPAVFNANINSTYIPVFSKKIYRKIPVYGLAYFDAFDFYYTVLGFESGQLEVGPIGFGGPTNSYGNPSSVKQFDGLVLRYTIGGGGYFRPAVSDQDPSNQLSTLSSAGQWAPHPNPAQAGQMLTLSGATKAPEQVQLIDLLGRVVQTWAQPNLAGQDIQLSLKGELVPGTYIIRTLHGEKQTTAPLVIR